MKLDCFAREQKDHLDLSQTHSRIIDRFGARIRELRLERNWTQQGMAVHVGMNRTFLCDIERGKKSASLRMMQVIALGLGLTLSDLVRGL